LAVGLTVGRYAINEVCYRCAHDKPFRAAMQADPEAALADVELTPEERRAILAGDVGALYLWGANTYLLFHLLRYKMVGLTLSSYQESLFAAAGTA
jgi:hypothetical protein